MIDWEIVSSVVMLAWLIYHDVRHKIKFGSIRLRPEKRTILRWLLWDSFIKKIIEYRILKKEKGGDKAEEKS